MSQKILITKFKFNVAPEEYKEILAPLGQTFAQVQGCQWKIWLIDEEKREGGAIYLFQNEKVLNDFINGPLVASVLAHPAISDFESRICDVLKALSETTRAPLTEATLA